MITRRHWMAAAAALVTFAMLAPSSVAEVSVETDDDGVYRRTVLRTNQSEKNYRVWAVSRNVGTRLVLNADGDGLGDLWPTIVGNDGDGGRPHVVWSRFDGTSFDLAWSRWTDEAGWSETDWVAGTAMPGDDLDPDLEFDPTDGRPSLVWWSDDGERGQVYLSVFLSSRWMSPYPVSAEGEDGRYPTVDILDDGTIRVSFETPGGTVVRFVRFHRPDTITDDLNPLEYLTLTDDRPGTINEQESGPP